MISIRKCAANDKSCGKGVCVGTLTVMIDIVAQGSDEQHQLVHTREALGNLAAHDEHVGAVQHIHHVAEVVVGVLVVVATHGGYEGHDFALIHLEELQHTAVCKDVVHHLDLQGAAWACESVCDLEETTKQTATGKNIGARPARGRY